MTVTIADFDASKMTIAKRSSMRDEMAQMWERLPAEGLSAQISGQVLTSAITAFDALNRLEELADKLAAAGPIAQAAAEEIRNAMKANF